MMMSRIRILLAPTLAALLFCWVLGGPARAQDAPAAQPDLQFQPADPDAPPPGAEQAAEPAGQPAASETAPSAAPETVQPAAPEAAQPADSETAPPAAPETAQPDALTAPETAQPAASETAPPAAPEAAPQMSGQAPVAEEATTEAAPPVPPRQILSDREWSRGALENLHGPHPTAVRVAILDTSGKSSRAGLIAFLLEDYRRRHLETRIGKRISVVNQSRMSAGKLRNSVIYYRPGNLRAALMMAEVIPGKQIVTPMGRNARDQIGVDIEIQVGRELP